MKKWTTRAIGGLRRKMRPRPRTAQAPLEIQPLPEIPEIEPIGEIPEVQPLLFPDFSPVSLLRRPRPANPRGSLLRSLALLLGATVATAAWRAQAVRREEFEQDQADFVTGCVPAPLSSREAAPEAIRRTPSRLCAPTERPAGDPEKMLVTVDAAIGIDRGFREPRRQRALARRQEEDYGGAVEDLTAILDSDPSDRDARRMRGECRLLGGNPVGAAEDLFLVVAKGAPDAQARIWLADAYDDLGDARSARRTLGRALSDWPSGTPEHARLDEALRRLSR